MNNSSVVKVRDSELGTAGLMAGRRTRDGGVGIARAAETAVVEQPRNRTRHGGTASARQGSNKPRHHVKFGQQRRTRASYVAKMLRCHGDRANRVSQLAEVQQREVKGTSLEFRSVHA
ncbi:hypothetical protein BT93_G0070 [Corymbia citriodora subsp. variegata]|nr:hypothetical protein BT93_G0070 [Corymbia citriodora subsp. variegata]